jgi:hypothetical protein
MIQLQIDLSLCGRFADALSRIPWMHEIEVEVVEREFVLQNPTHAAYFKGFFFSPSNFTISQEDDVIWVGNDDYKIAYRRKPCTTD